MNSLQQTVRASSRKAFLASGAGPGVLIPRSPFNHPGSRPPEEPTVKFDHVAVNVADIARSVEWYKAKLGAEVIYQDATWAFLQAGGTKLAPHASRPAPGPRRL